MDDDEGEFKESDNKIFYPLSQLGWEWCNLQKSTYTQWNEKLRRGVEALGMACPQMALETLSPGQLQGHCLSSFFSSCSNKDYSEPTRKEMELSVTNSFTGEDAVKSPCVCVTNNQIVWL